VYNASERRLPTSRISGVLTAFWVLVVAGGFLGLLLPAFVLATPLAKALPAGLLSNDVVSGMVFPRFSQYNPGAYFAIDPRPAAPFTYTNNWGNSYSVLLPFVLVYLTTARRRGWRWWSVIVLVPMSLVPAFLTLNRGMFLALILAATYVIVRRIGRGDARALLAAVLLATTAAVVFAALPVQSRVESRLENSSTNASRLSAYDEAWQRTLDSPVFGYGAPRRSVNPGAPAIGTQGQFWMVMFSHGFLGAALFLSWFVWVCWRGMRAPTTVDVLLHSVSLMTLLEVFYYGILGSGLVVAMIAAAVVLRHQDRLEPRGLPHR
jgi:polysaccharide biosynthesis protein PslJ